MQERRLDNRYNLTGNVDLKTEDRDRRILRAYLDDIGLGGFRTYSKEKIDAFKDVEFEIMTESLGYPLSGRGNIRYVNAVEMYGNDFFSIGVQFTDIDRKRIKDLISVSLGLHKRPLLSEQHKRELLLLLKLSPLIILIAWPILKAINNYKLLFWFFGQK